VKPDPNFTQAVFEAVKRRDADSAVLLCKEYDRAHPVSHTELLVGASVREIRWIFEASPKLLWRFPFDLLDLARTASAMNFLIGSVRYRDWLPGDSLTSRGFDLEYAARMIANYVQSKQNIETAKQVDVGAVEITQSNDPPCVSCLALRGQRWKLGEEPELPYEHCIHPWGCRCAYIFFTKDEI
jgi:hypothetical protein